MDVISSRLYLARSASFYTLCTLVWKRCREWALYTYLYIIPTLFAYFLVCHPYIFFYFYFLSKIGLVKGGGTNLSLHVPILINNRVVTMTIVWPYYLYYTAKEILIPLAISGPAMLYLWVCQGTQPCTYITPTLLGARLQRRSDTVELYWLRSH